MSEPTLGIIGGGQLGSIWGFPLFNVDEDGNQTEKGPQNWTFFQSCITGTTVHPNGGTDISGNERMLVNLNKKT